MIGGLQQLIPQERCWSIWNAIAQWMCCWGATTGCWLGGYVAILESNSSVGIGELVMLAERRKGLLTRDRCSIAGIS